MKKIIASVLIVLIISTVYGQNITGRWNGVLKVQGMQLRIGFNISATDTGFISTMDSPDQHAKDIAVTTTTFQHSKLVLEITKAGIEYDGELKDNIITGTFRQAGQQFPVDLSRDSVEKKTLVRPQEPVKPYPYYSEDITFQNTNAQITLAGTLTLPA